MSKGELNFRFGVLAALGGTVTLASDVYIGKLTCSLTKSNWQVQQVTLGG